MKTEEAKVISSALSSAYFYGVETEVVYSALEFIKENPNEGIITAIEYGLSEWVK